MLIALVAALFVESVWESAKMVWQSGKLEIDRLGAIILGVLVAILARINLFSLAGLALDPPIAAYIMSGFILSRGANFVHDLIKRVEGAGA